MAKSSIVRWAQVGAGFLGALSAWPIFLFVGAGGVRVSIFSPESPLDCWQGLPSWSGTPIPLVLPILLVTALISSVPQFLHWRRIWHKDWGLIASMLIISVAVLLVAGPARGLQLLAPLVLLASIPQLLSCPNRIAMACGWLFGATIFFTLQMLSIWHAAGVPLLLAHRAVVPGVAGDWGFTETCRLWGLCIYQAPMTVPDLALSLATVTGLLAIGFKPGQRLLAITSGFAWLVAIVYAFNLGRTAVLVILVIQALIALGLMRGALRGRLAMVPGIPLGILVFSLPFTFKPVLLDRLLSKISVSALFDRLPIWSHAAQNLINNPLILVGGRVGTASLNTPGTHSLLGDVIFRIGLPLTILYFFILMVFAIRAVAACLAQASPAARSGLALLLVIPVVQSLINASLLQPFSLFNVVLAALALVTFV